MKRVRPVSGQIDSSLSATSMARLAGLLYLGCGTLGVLLVALPDVIRDNRIVMVAIVVSAWAVGIFALVAPWDRWPPRANLWLARFAFALVATAGTLDVSLPHAYGALCIVIFTWIGIAHPRWTSVRFAPLAVITFLGPLLYRPIVGGVMGGVAASLIVVPVGLLVGEALAAMAQQLRLAASTDHERLHGMHALVAVSATLAQPHEAPSLPDHVARMALEPLHATAALVTFLEADGSLLGAGSANWPREPRAVRLDPWLTPTVHHTLTNGALTKVRAPDELGCPQAAAVAIRGSGENLGVLFLVTEDPDDPFLQDLAHTYATQAGLALERSWATQTLVDATLRDELTGVGNRRHGNAVLARLQVGDAVAMLDLDHFKEVNDTLGHAQGDQVLKALAEYLRSQLRDEDHLARYGGEEFLLILHRSGPDAVQTIERLREGWNETGPATGFSTGVAVHRMGVLPNHTLENADHALYEAKKAGRDRTALYGAGEPRTEEAERPRRSAQ